MQAVFQIRKHYYPNPDIQVRVKLHLDPDPNQRRQIIFRKNTSKSFPNVISNLSNRVPYQNVSYFPKILIFNVESPRGRVSKQNDSYADPQSFIQIFSLLFRNPPVTAPPPRHIAQPSRSATPLTTTPRCTPRKSSSTTPLLLLSPPSGHKFNPAVVSFR